VDADPLARLPAEVEAKADPAARHPFYQDLAYVAHVGP
jgi:hypothetical protein